MLYYKPITEESVKISREKFKKIFGISYKKSDYGIRFEDAHCINCPYNEDLYGQIVPIVARTSDAMWDEYRNSNDEI